MSMPGVRVERRGGFTLIEMTMTMGIMAVMGSVVVGDWVGSRARQGLEHARLQLLGDLRAARTEAVTRNLNVQVSFSDALSQYTIWADEDGDGTMDAGEFETKDLDANDQVHLWSHPKQGTFLPSGCFSSRESFGYFALSGPEGYHALHVTPLGQVGEVTQSACPPEVDGETL